MNIKQIFIYLFIASGCNFIHVKIIIQIIIITIIIIVCI